MEGGYVVLRRLLEEGKIRPKEAVLEALSACLEAVRMSSSSLVIGASRNTRAAR